MHQIGDYCCPSCTQPDNQEKCASPDAGRIAFSLEDADGKIHWYCSYEATSGTNFISTNGKTVNCTTTQDIMIPNTNESWKLCQNCQSANRTVIEREDGDYCIRK